MNIRSESFITKPVYYGVVIAFFALALIIFFFRMLIRIQRMQGLYVDDYFLVLAILSLITSHGLIFSGIPNLFLFNDVLAGLAPLPSNILELATNTSICFSIGQSLVWAAIFAVKFSFLFVFRPLVRRIQPLETLWWCTFILCIPLACVSVATPWIICPDTGADLLTHCVTSPPFLRAEMILLYYDVAADTATDTLLISIPIALLWKTRLSVRQKMSIGVVLCLSAVMICINLVRGISARVYGTSDQIWVTLWVQVEASVATIMVSLSAFRQLFILGGSSSSVQIQRRWNRSSPASPSSVRASKVFFWKKGSTNSEESRLPKREVGAAMMGTRTLISANGRTTTESLREGSSMQYVWAGTPEPAHFAYRR